MTKDHCLLGRGGSAPNPIVGRALRPAGEGALRALIGCRLVLGVVEIFAGSQTFTRVWQSRGHPVYPVDINISADHVFSSQAGPDHAWEVIQDMISNSHVARGSALQPVVHLAPPCNTYSTCRHPKLRSGAHPRGLPRGQLNAHQQKVLKHANKVTKNTFILMQKLAAEGIPHTIEQPIGSMMLKDPAFKSWASRSGAQRVVVDQCQFDRPYRKRTAIWGAPSGLLDGLTRICPGGHKHAASLGNWGWKDHNHVRRHGRNRSTNQGSSAHPEGLCSEWRRIMLHNLGDI